MRFFFLEFRVLLQICGGRTSGSNSCLLLFEELGSCFKHENHGAPGKNHDAPSKTHGTSTCETSPGTADGLLLRPSDASDATGAGAYDSASLKACASSSATGAGADDAASLKACASASATETDGNDEPSTLCGQFKNPCFV